MAKLTRKAYFTNKTRLLEAIAATVSALESMDREYAGHNLTMDVSQAWNDLHDYEYDLRSDLESLERGWSVRDWTAQDFQHYALVCENRD